MIALICGATGTLGNHVVRLLLKNRQIERVRLLSRGEHKQIEMAERLKGERVDFFVGDIRDRDRIIQASQNVDLVFHFAAMKSVDHAEYNPLEAVKTNIDGTENVIDACLKNNIQRAIFTSTDKACAPLNIYGATKLVAEKLFIQGNIGRHKTRFSVCRYGNVLSSQGSVIEKWKKAVALKQKIKITDPEMTRFFISPKAAAQFVYDCIFEMNGAEVFIPKMKSITMINLARAFIPGFKLHDVEWIGIRPGEKITEMLISDDEISMTTDVGDKFIRWPTHNLFPFNKRGQPIEKSLNSKNAVRFSLSEIKELLDDQ